MDSIRNYNILHSKWQKAAVIGSLWGSIEIILGSFLHNVNIPFSGNLLSTIGIILLVSTQVVYVEKGILWRAGLICALMKSISPSAIILGPMICIFAEAVFLEAGIRVFGRNLMGYIIGGVFAGLTSIFYKIGFQILMYGADIIQIYVKLYDLAASRLHLNSISAWQMITCLFIIYAITGIIGAICGYLVGFKVLKTQRQKGAIPTLTDNSNLFQENNNTSFSWIRFMFHIVIIFAGLLFMSSLSIIYSTILVIGYVIFISIIYKSSLKKLTKPMIWVQMILLTFLASLFIKSKSNEYLSMEGFIAGIEMNLRALLLIFGFHALSIDLRNPLVKNILYRNKTASLTLSLELAFQILPDAIANLSKPRDVLRNPMLSVLNLIKTGEMRIAQFHNKTIILLTGNKNEGKTTLLKELISLLKNKSIDCSGIITYGVFQNEFKHKYIVENIENGNQAVLCEFMGNEHLPYPYQFCEPGIQLGINTLISAQYSPESVVIIDEVGPLELSENGWSPALNKILKNEFNTMIISVRNSIIDEVIQKWNLQNVQKLNVRETSALYIYKQVEKSLSL